MKASLLAGVLALGITSSASAAIIVTTYRGVIDTGQDHIGLLGASGADLAGLSYTAKFTIDTSINRYTPDATSDAVVGPGYPEAASSENPFLSAVVTINGTPIVLPLSGLNYAYVDTVSLVHENGLNSQQSWYFSASDSGIPNNLDTPFSVALSFATGNVTLRDNLGNETFVFVGGVQRVSSAIAGVPEPATWALMIGGFGAAGAMLRRSRRIASPA